MKITLPYHTEKTSITVQNEAVEIKAFQIIVWVRISHANMKTWDPSIPKLPAILDTGTTHNFALTKHHLKRWSGNHAGTLQEFGRIRVAGVRAPLLRCALWLDAGGEPFRLNIHEGIAVFDGDWPRLPILGLRALNEQQSPNAHLR